VTRAYVLAGEEEQEVTVDAAAEGLAAAGAAPHGGTRPRLSRRRRVSVLVLFGGEVDTPPQQRLVEG
jgi:hypothetical protein